MDKMREEFEEWAKDKYILEVSKYGGYRAVATKNAFDAWQASRQALVVELPKLLLNCEIDAIDYVDTVKAIKSAGVKYK